MVAAGSLVSCGCVLSGAMACGVAIRVAASRTPLPRAVVRILAAAHHVLEVVLAGHQVMLGCHLRRIAQPLGDRVGGVPLHPVGLARRPEIPEKPWPGFVAGFGADALQVSSEVHAVPSRHGHDGRRPWFSLTDAEVRSRGGCGMITSSERMVRTFRLAVARGKRASDTPPRLAVAIEHLEGWADACTRTLREGESAVYVLVEVRRPVRFQAANDIAATCPHYVPRSFKVLA
jgi:hypothetical protein